ncbi:hypothetical protein ARAF_0777 [Arsenophonus endosymbiont of Aleurodicus floccissimus]|uniref:DUF2612 domain-containing protein n=1 Tax=Arsenophonus endosymbiont of Aleurodicus floccissimus TaxID=2152761 RepID=UPI000EC91EB5|nr:DUF2612 domain-containing protein [Arsenophonus endosymbiont of Aleurodicus floccissimus]SPP31635.1 hypothetical protein ARAF_0777 [Arsenophonus endosymbiont of Aleurodicus floccissimus]
MRDYTEYITPQHRQAEKITQHIELMTRALVDISALSAKLNAFFSIDSGMGKQVDAVGEWIGLSRFVKTPIKGVYFHWIPKR